MFSAQYILIIDSKGNNSPFLDGILKNDSLINLIVADNLPNGFKMVGQYEPDLILVHDNLDEDITGICAQIRTKTSFYRPVLLVLSGTESVERKIEILQAGADDYQHESIDNKELSLRIFAHLRRHIEELTDPITRLPGVNLSYRILKRSVKTKSNDKYALMYINIGNFDPYKEVYGYIASEKLLQTAIAIIRTAVNEDDFLGKIENECFIVLTSPEKAEKIAVFLCYSFDMVSQKFYSTEDTDRGYLIIDGDEKVGRRISFVSVSIGIVSNQYQKFENLEEVMNSVIDMNRLAKSKPGSYWVSDRPKITNSEDEGEVKKKILIVENDAALSYLLITTLEMQGYNAESINSPDQTLEMIEKIRPALVVFDTSSENAEKELEICRIIKQSYSDIKVIVSTADCNKEKVLDTGVDLYMPKPYELFVLFSWISRFLNYEVLH